jgi:hypothetical protein
MISSNLQSNDTILSIVLLLNMVLYSDHDHCIYHWNSVSIFIYFFLSLYVYDILITDNDVLFTNKLKYFLKPHFMKDLDEASYTLDIQITRDRKCRTLYPYQEQYLDEI